MKPRLLDLFCCAGGAGYGYHLAGFNVVGVDINPQPNYPFPFIQMDALQFLWDGCAEDPATGNYFYVSRFDAIHASPPCQFATVYGNNKKHVKDDHPNLIPKTRELLQHWQVPYIIENVEGARKELVDPVKLCGTGFGIEVRRHRYFESNIPLVGMPCDHKRFTERKYPGSSNRPNGRTVCNVGEWRVPIEQQQAAMQIDWMTVPEMSQAIPPAYTEHLGKQLLAHMAREEAIAA